MSNSENEDLHVASTKTPGMQIINEGKVRWLIWMLFSFKGRLSRLPYFLSTFVVYGVAAILAISAMSLGDMTLIRGIGVDGSTVIDEDLLLVVFAIGFIPLVWSGLAVGFKRAHDMGYSGWFVIAMIVLGFIPIVGAIIQLVMGLFLLFGSGSMTPNQYGERSNDPTATYS